MLDRYARTLALCFSLVSGCAPAPLASDGADAGRAADANTDGGARDDARSTIDAGPRDGGRPTFRDAHPRIYLDDENRARLSSALATPSEAARRFRAMVDAQLAGTDHYEFRASDAALLYALLGEPRYADYAIARVDARVVEEEARIARGERAEIAADSYLYVGDGVGDLALVYDWCFDRMTDAQRARWRAYADQAVWNVWHHEEASWGGVVHPWSGWSIENPSNNYYYSFLEATMLLGLATRGESDSAETWLATFRDAKIGAELVPTFARDLAGGGSREGTGYGTAMRRLFWIYDLWRGSTGEDLARLGPHAHDSLAYLMHATMPTLDRLAPIGDHARDSTAALFDYHRAYALALMRIFEGDPLSEIAASYVRGSSVPRVTQAFMMFFDFVHDDAAISARPLAELSSTYYARGTGHVFWRAGWGRDATWVGAIAGPYTESHAHRDQGSLLVFRREWLVYDQNILSHSGIVQDERAHALVRLERGGAVVPQREGAGPARVVGLRRGASHTWIALDVAAAYGAGAGVGRDEREILILEGGDVIVVADRVDADRGTSRIFSLSTPIRPSVSGSITTIRGAESTLALHTVRPTAPTIATIEWAREDADMSGGYRVEVAERDESGRSRMLHVMGIDGTVSSVAIDDAAGAFGVRVTLARGGSVRARFADDAVGATLEADGETVELTAGLDAIGVFAP